MRPRSARHGWLRSWGLGTVLVASPWNFPYAIPGGGVFAALMAGNEAYIAHVGDSRAYRINDAGIEQITVDHSLVESLVASNQITREEARHHPQSNVIYRTIGDKRQVTVDLDLVTLAPGDSLLLCSDGLSGMLTDDQLQHLVATAASPQAACDALIDAANRAGGGGSDVDRRRRPAGRAPVGEGAGHCLVGGKHIYFDFRAHFITADRLVVGRAEFTQIAVGGAAVFFEMAHQGTGDVFFGDLFKTQLQSLVAMVFQGAFAYHLAGAGFDHCDRNYLAIGIEDLGHADLSSNKPF